ncbi:MAG: YciI family protein [Pseudonocardiaceae bacterium]|nr:YciI family protein [Pseudonocardiaceae bacterium]
MKYLILIHSNPASRAAWDKMSDEQRAGFAHAHLELTKELTAAGILRAGEGLQDIETAKRVAVRDGRTLTSDGPFAEVKEHLAGFYLVEVTDLDEAVAIAARMPDAQHSEVEVRPVYDLSQLEP